MLFLFIYTYYGKASKIILTKEILYDLSFMLNPTKHKTKNQPHR